MGKKEVVLRLVAISSAPPLYTVTGKCINGGFHFSYYVVGSKSDKNETRSCERRLVGTVRPSAVDSGAVPLPDRHGGRLHTEGATLHMTLTILDNSVHKCALHMTLDNTR